MVKHPSMECNLGEFTSSLLGRVHCAEFTQLFAAFCFYVPTSAAKRASNCHHYRSIDPVDNRHLQRRSENNATLTEISADGSNQFIHYAVNKSGIDTACSSSSQDFYHHPKKRSIAKVDSLINEAYISPIGYLAKFNTMVKVDRIWR